MAKRRAKPAPARRGKRGSFRLRGIASAVAVLLLAAAGWHFGGDTARETAAPLIANTGIAIPGTPRPGTQTREILPREGYIVATVARVIDGDTLEVPISGEFHRVRLRCVNTPESVHPDRSRNTPLGAEAAGFTRRRLEGQQVRLLREPDGDERDRFGRLLAYVLIDGENFNVELVRKGYSKYETRYGRSKLYHSEFRDAEKDAKAAGAGVWAQGADTGDGD
jgi:endonuclease YncB( thermonuclease family)